MDFPFGKNAVIFLENNIEINNIKEYFRKNSAFKYLEDLDFKTVNSFIEEEVDLFWPLIESEETPKIISRNVSICILNKIIGDRRMFDAFFAALNSADIYIAQRIYSIMMNSAEHNIPVIESANRIERFKRGLIKKNLYLDLENIIREYRSIMNLFGIVDFPMILEKYPLLLKKEGYQRHLANKKYFIANKIYENRIIYSKIMEDIDLKAKLESNELVAVEGIDEILSLCRNFSYGNKSSRRKTSKAETIFSEEVQIGNKILDEFKIKISEKEKSNTYLLNDYIIRKVDISKENEIISNLFAEDIVKEKKYETVDIAKVRKDVKIAQLNNYKYKGSTYDLDFDNYFQMEAEMTRLLKSILNSNVKENDIAIIVPRLNSTIVSMIENIKEKLDVQIEKISDRNKINNSRVALSSIISYGIKDDYNSFLNEDDKVEFVKFILDGIIRNRENNSLLDEDIVDKDGNNFIDERALSENIYEKEFGIDLYKIKKEDVNYIYIRRNLNTLMNIIRKDRRILPDRAKSMEEVSEYIKKFFKLYADIDEENINEVSYICDLINELSIFNEDEKKEAFILSEEKKLDYIKKYISTFTPTRRRLERASLNRVILLTYDEYIQMKLDRKVKIVFDARSPLYDEKIEDELNTEIAYLDDSILSEIGTDMITKRADSRELARLSSRLEDRKISEKLSIFFANEKEDESLYILSSYKSLAGYEIENRFYEKLILSAGDNIEKVQLD